MQNNRDEREEEISESVGTEEFEKILGKYGHIVKAVAATLSVPESEREDLYQEGLFALYRAMCNYDESVAKFSTFASACIRRAMLTWIRDHVSKKGADGRPITEIPIDQALSSDIPDDSETPEELFIMKEQILSLKSRALKCLSDYERCVFLMHLDNMTASEIATALGKEGEKGKKSIENALLRIKKKISGKKTDGQKKDS